MDLAEARGSLVVDAGTVGDAKEQDKKKGQGVEFACCPNDGGAAKGKLGVG